MKMLEAIGKFNSAKMFTDRVEKGAFYQIVELCNQKIYEGEQIRIMPDVHQGAGGPIGLTMTISGSISPNLVGVDIGCGVLTIELKESNIDLDKLDAVINEKVPSGFNIHKEPLIGKYKAFICDDLLCAKEVDLERAKLSLGSLGGGNHYMEVGRSEKNDCLYLTIHSGSRNIGKQVAEYYQKIAIKEMDTHKKDRDSLIKKMKALGREVDISAALRALEDSPKEKTPETLAYLSGKSFKNYIHDMKIIQGFADLNRRAIAQVVVSEMKLSTRSHFATVHNYIDTENMVLRKGAVSAQSGEKLIIPINMRDGSILCRGKGNPDWNYSAPHGAGRVMSRRIAKDHISLEDFQESMVGIYSTSVNKSTIDESPMAYKSMSDITTYINDTVDILEVIKPIYNFKAH